MLDALLIGWMVGTKFEKFLANFSGLKAWPRGYLTFINV